MPNRHRVKHVYRIHPAIGIARVGDSERGYFLGPELPGVPPLPLAGRGESFRDGGIKRQAAQFRLFEFVVDASGRLSTYREITLDTPGIEEIRWTVHLANTKASFHRFEGALGDPTAVPPVDSGTPAPRNAVFTNAQERRKRLEIDPGARSIGGRSVTTGAAFAPGGHRHETWPTMDDTSDGEPAIDYLGELHTDDVGRLRVLGGRGRARRGARGEELNDDNYANYDGWYDDVSDGPVSAQLRFANGRTVDVGGWTATACADGEPLAHGGGAWVIVGPPKFAPHLEPVISLYARLSEVALHGVPLDPNAAYDVAGTALWRLKQFRIDPMYRPSYTHEIQPLLRRAFESRFVFGEAAEKHHTISSEMWAMLGDPSEAVSNRQFVFRYLRPPFPRTVPDEWTASMPMLFGDQYVDVTFDGPDAPVGEFLWLTETQYELLRRWSEGQFIADWTGAPAPPEETITPDGLDRAALDAAIGGAFFPGIELSWQARNPSIFAEPFRIKHDATIRAGHFTRQMALPWQADFFDCSKSTVTYNATDPAMQMTDVMTWWPTHRPDDVLPRGGDARVPWARTPDGAEIAHKPEFLAAWRSLGFVVDTSGDRSRFEEIDRG